MASTICMVHCIATPFLFVVHTCSSTCCEAAPIWWKWLDYFFLIVAFFAVYHAAKTTANKGIAKGLWLSWTALLAVIVNEGVSLLHLPEGAIYFPAFSLVALHLYNKRFCRCLAEQCCADKLKNTVRAPSAIGRR